MENASPSLIELLLQSGDGVVLHLDSTGALVSVSNDTLFASWLPDGGSLPRPGATLAFTLSGLFDDARTLQLLTAYETFAAGTDAVVTNPATPARIARLAPPRWFDVGFARVAEGPDTRIVVLIANRTLQQTLANAAADARAAHELALTVLRTEPAALRQFLATAGSALGFIRVTLRQPARRQDALRDKLALLRAEADSLHAAATRLALRGVAGACQLLVAELDRLLLHESLSGDDLLPLARRIDAIAASIGALSNLDEQRAASAAPSAPVAAPRPAPRAVIAWHEVCEQRANDLIQRLGSQFGRLARLRMKGSALVPEKFHRQVESTLEPLLGNAMRHGVETPEERLAADKPAAATITVSFRNRDAAGLEMSVHDDGRGFDLERIRRAAVASGVLEAGSAAGVAARELVGLIFKPGFSTAQLEEQPGEGGGMTLLRESLQRQGGNISVATKAQRYTQFTVRFPASESIAARHRSSRNALP